MQTIEFYLVHQCSRYCFDISQHDDRSIYLCRSTIRQSQMAKTTNGSPIEYHHLVKFVNENHRSTLIQSFPSRLVSCVFASPFYHHYGIESSPNNPPQCVLLSEEHLQKYFRIYTVTLYYFIPLTIIIISYTSLLYFIYSKEQKLKMNTVNHFHVDRFFFSKRLPFFVLFC